MHKVLIFDSELGGLSIFKSLYNLMPKNQYIYLSDNKYFPYGELDDDFLHSRIENLIILINQKFTFDLIIIACNTASTLVFNSLQSKINTKIIPVQPEIKTAQKLSKTKHIGVIATPNTIKRKYLQDLAKTEINYNIDLFATNKLANLAKIKLMNDHVSIEDIKSEIPNLTNSNLDVLILGCTHFPLLKQEIQTILPKILCFDSSNRIANKAKKYLANKTPIQRNLQQNTVYLTNADLEISNIFKKLNFEIKLM